MNESSPETCPACGGQGWLFCNTGNDAAPEHAIQRCDACETFDSDQAALAAVVKAAEGQPGLLDFVERVSRLRHEGEPGEDDEPFERTSEDTIATLNEIITDARQLLGTADRCSECGQFVPYVIGCPDGAELCRDCFEAGGH